VDNKNESIYDELEKLNVENIFASENLNNNTGVIGAGAKKTEVRPEDCLYDKSYTCPVCGNSFKSKAVRKGKTKFISNELDLKPVYKPIQPDYYDIVLCNVCGYAAISSKFDKITYSQEEAIHKNITPKFYPKLYPDIYTVDTAIERYKIALLNCIIKKSHAGEKAYICLKLAWFYREKSDIKNELTFLKAAHKGFNAAFVNENFPICGLDENTLLYIIAAIGARIGKIDDSLRILGRLVVKRNLTPRLKLKITELREILKKIKR